MSTLLCYNCTSSPVVTPKRLCQECESFQDPEDECPLTAEVKQLVLCDGSQGDIIDLNLYRWCKVHSAFTIVNDLCLPECVISERLTRIKLAEQIPTMMNYYCFWCREHINSRSIRCSHCRYWYCNDCWPVSCTICGIRSCSICEVMITLCDGNFVHHNHLIYDADDFAMCAIHNSICYISSEDTCVPYINQEEYDNKVQEFLDM